MEVTQTINDGLKRGFSIKLGADELDARVDEKLKEAAPNVSLKGFRKGKVPMNHLKKVFGKSVLGEALQESIDGAVSEEIEKSGDRPALKPDVKMKDEDWKEGQDVEVEVNYERLPDIPELDLSTISLERNKVEVEAGAIDEALENLAKSATNFEPRKKGAKAKEGDQLIIDFTGSIDGEEFEGGKGEEFPLTLGSGSFIPGFEDKLIGASAEADLDIEVTFPEDYQAAHLAGKDALFKVHVHEVKEPKPAVIDDALAKRYGADDLEAFKAQIKERLQSEYDDACRAVMKRRLMDALDGMVDFEVPSVLLDAEASNIAHQLWHEANPDVKGHDHEEIKPDDDHIKLALRRVRLGLLLADIGEKASVEVNEVEMREGIMKAASQYGPQASQFLEYLQKTPAAQQQIRAPIFEDKVIDHIVASAKVSEKAMTKDELDKALEALEEF